MTDAHEKRVSDLKVRLKRRRDELQRYLNTEFYESCRLILKTAEALDKDRVFESDPSSLPDYPMRVGSPMYWKLIRKKLEHYLYKSVEDFIANMRTLVNNCYLYNGVQASVSSTARAIEVLMEDMFVKELGVAPVLPLDVKKACTGMSSSDSKEVLRIYALYEDIDVSGVAKSTHIRLNTAKSATLRRLLEYARSSAENRAKQVRNRRTAKIHQTTSRSRVPAVTGARVLVQRDAEVTFHQDTEPRLEHVPQNAQTGLAMMEEVSPIRIDEGDWFDDGDEGETA